VQSEASKTTVRKQRILLNEKTSVLLPTSLKIDGLLFLNMPAINVATAFIDDLKSDSETTSRWDSELLFEAQIAQLNLN
jgi:hypothetical protein